MNAIREFIEQRRSECEEKIARLQADEREDRARSELRRAEIDTLYAEIQELERAARAIGDAEKHQQVAAERSVEERSPVTIKDAVLAVLVDAPGGLIAMDILRQINQRFRMELVRTSLSPQLTRLKKAGAVELNGSTWTAVLKNNTSPSMEIDGRTEIGPEA